MSSFFPEIYAKYKRNAQIASRLAGRFPSEDLREILMEQPQHHAPAGCDPHPQDLSHVLLFFGRSKIGSEGMACLTYTHCPELNALGLMWSLCGLAWMPQRQAPIAPSALFDSEFRGSTEMTR